MIKHLLLFAFLSLFVSSIHSQGNMLYPFSDQTGLKWGYMDRDFKIIHEPKFDEISYLEKRNNVVMMNYQYGMLNQYGEWVIPAKFEKIEEESSANTIIATTKDSVYFYSNFDDYHLRAKLPIKHYEITNVTSRLNGQYLRYKHSELVTMIYLPEDKIISENKYNSITNFDEFSNRVKKIRIFKSGTEKKVNVIDEAVARTHFIVEKNKMYGLLNSTSKKIDIPCKYIGFNIQFPIDSSDEYYIEAILSDESSHYFNEKYIQINKPRNQKTEEELSPFEGFGDAAGYGPPAQVAYIPEPSLFQPDFERNVPNTQEKINISYKHQAQNNNSGTIQKILVENNTVIVLETIHIENIRGIKPTAYDSDANPVYQIRHMDERKDLINTKGESLLPANYGSFAHSYNQFWLYYLNPKFGFIDVQSVKTSEAIFSKVSNVHFDERIKRIELPNGVIGHYDIVKDRLYIPGYENKSIYKE